MLRVRFAPSPTGFLHIGGARTALFNWIQARKSGGEFILRIEDTDQSRSKPEYLKEILASLKWLNLDWDKIYYQSKRFSIYQDYAQKLIDKGFAYKRDEAIFFKYNFDQVRINDLIRGEVIFSELPKSEEVIIKRDKTPTYNFSCCVDDALMEINCVIRGEDHLSNTPKQILIYEALGFDVPDFAHIPLTLSPDGGRLSKRYGATAISEYRKAGYLPEALTNYFLLLGWSAGQDREILSLEEAKSLFKLEDLNKTGAAFSLEKLNWINAQYIRKKSLGQLAKEIKEYLNQAGHHYANQSDADLEKAVSLFRTRLVTLAEFASQADFLFNQEITYSKDTEDVLKSKLIKEIKELELALLNLDDFGQEAIEVAFRSVAKQLGLKLGVLVHPVRIALTGRKTGPGLFETMAALGKDKVIDRLKKLINYWDKSLGPN